MPNNPEIIKRKPYPSCACADCLETAGGRQLTYNCAWWVEFCPVCNHKTSVTDPKNFGNPSIDGFYRPLTTGKAKI